MKSFSLKFRIRLIGLFLIFSTLIVYIQVYDFDFVNFDDPYYVSHNHKIRKGITTDNILWAFTAVVAGNWHPLTLLSHMLDCQLFGINAGIHHLTNLFIHMANTLLLFFVFKRMTGTIWQSGFLAALFGLHPLHVESVAWISERKDVLSTFFWMLTMWSYVKYTEHPCTKRYLPIFLFTLLGLMAKPMLVTLPFVLLLLDYWPLGRLQGTQFFPNARQLVLEKVPLFALVAGACIVTMLAQQASGAVANFTQRPFDLRLYTALLSYSGYILKTLFPFHLAAYYPYSFTYSWLHLAGTCLFLIFISFFAIKKIKSSPYIAVGWFWYLGTLVPVIGLVQVGSQPMADRYTYVPLIGIFIILAWGIPELINKTGISKWRYYKTGLCITGTTLFVILMVATWTQTRYWKNSITLWEHTIEITNNNFVAHHNLAIALAHKGFFNEAFTHYQTALRLRPENMDVYYNIACLYAIQNKSDESVRWLKKAIHKGFNKWELLRTDKDLENIRNSYYYRMLLRNNQ